MLFVPAAALLVMPQRPMFWFHPSTPTPTVGQPMTFMVRSIYVTTLQYVVVSSGHVWYGGLVNVPVTPGGYTEITTNRSFVAGDYLQLRMANDANFIRYSNSAF